MDILQNIYEKPGCILFVQTDHISGEIIGSAIDDLYKAGAFNVQVLSSVTKKNRPGYLFFIDVAVDYNPKIEAIIINELGATGWHRMESDHRHVGTRVIQHTVVFETPNGAVSLPVNIKVLKDLPERMRPEHADCLRLREALSQNGLHLSLNEITQAIIRQASVSLSQT